MRPFLMVDVSSALAAGLKPAAAPAAINAQSDAALTLFERMLMSVFLSPARGKRAPLYNMTA
jgi:hypothetical protein